VYSMVKVKKVKLSLLQAMEAHRVAKEVKAPTLLRQTANR
jgi:hypothetical protein